MIIAPLVPVPELDAGLYAKIEYLHPSGSMKHRALPPLLEARVRAGAILPGQRLAVVSAGSGALAVAWSAARLGHAALAVLPKSAPRQIVRQLEWLGASCELIDADEVPSTLAQLEADPDTYLVSQSHEPEVVDHYRPVAREILDALPDVAAITVGLGTGASATGIGREVAARAVGARCRVVGVEPAEAAIASGRPWAPHTLHGLAPPMPQPLLDRRVLTDIVTVASAEAWRIAREVGRRAGLPVGPSSGATIAAALALRAQGVAGPIVAVCSCAIGDYLDGARPL